jgi:hypothetical protein
MDKDKRNAIERGTQRARKLLEEDFAVQLEGDFDVHRGGAVAAKSGAHLTARQAFQRERIVAAIEHKRAAGMSAVNAVADYLRDAAFTTLNRFVALKMLEARELVQDCITKGEQSSGYREFCGMAPGLALLPDTAGYRLYIECLFDELSTEVKVLFDRRDPSAVLWPKRATFAQLLEILNAGELSKVWGEDETIGWVYQFFNGQDERRKMREESEAPRNSRELAVRNQFFTPRYVVQFLTDNTLGRIWYEMRGTKTALADRCEYMVRKRAEELAPRPKKDPRDLRVLDPACGSGHFLLYAFDLLLAIYEEAHSDPASPKSEATGRTLADDYPSIDALRRAAPGLILAHNLYGVDIDARCAQIAQLALWMRTQKAYRDFGIGRAERPQIRRSNVVVAEPLVADEQLAKEFVGRFKDAELGRVFAGLVDALKLAGEMGLLLRIETLVARPTKRGQTSHLFASPQERIRDALALFVAEEGARLSTRRRLFVDDAAHGIALLSLAERRFDVVLMNPPFGLITDDGQGVLAIQYAGAHNDVFAAFVRRAREMCAGGYVGAISSRSFLVTRRLERFRRDDFLPSVRVLWDLGLAVMDAAFVETAAYVLSVDGKAPKTFLAFDGKRDASPEKRELPTKWLEVNREQFARLPLAKILYKLPERIHALLASSMQFEPTIGTARQGMTSFHNGRFLRLWWEVDPSDIGVGWRWFAKGGAHAFLYQDFLLLLDWRKEGAALQAVNVALNGTTSQVRQASDYWYRSGATYSRRSARGFSARLLPAGFIFSDKGPAVLLNDGAPVSREYLLGWLNSRLIRALIHVQANASEFLTGILKNLPWQNPTTEAQESVHAAVASSICLMKALASERERSPLFSLRERKVVSFDDLLSLTEADARALSAAIAKTLAVCDQRIDEIYQDDSTIWTDDVFARDEAAAETDEGDEDSSDFEATSAAWAAVSRCIGVALGRFRVRDATAEKVPESSDELFAPIPTLVKTGLSWEDSLAVDDEGHPRDLVALLLEAAWSVFGLSKEEFERGVARTFGTSSIREFIRGTGAESAWGRHLQGYSGARRKAPIYWRLSTSSGRYSIWIAYHSLGTDTWFKVLSDVVEPRIVLEEQRLAAATQEDRGAFSRRRVAAHEATLAELKELRDELRRIASIWTVDRSDGIPVAACPLWALFSHHRSWQKELRATWDAMCAGDYDWSHLAMHLWPERIILKCATDRSLAVAHGLENVFWVEGSDGKWTARKTPTRTIEELVRERTSPAVKAALKSLLEASAATGNDSRGRGGRRRVAAKAEGGKA